MKPRFAILLVAAAIVGVALYVKKTAPPVPTAPEAEDAADALSPEEQQRLDVQKTPLDRRPLPGREPPDPPVLSTTVEVDTSSGKNRVCAFVTEAHGYYVETFRIRIFHKGQNGGDGTPALEFEHYADSYLKANDTLRECVEVVPAELGDIGGEIGTSEDWGAEVTYHGRARLENPDPLPVQAARR